MTGPYAESAAGYQRKGWSPLPLPAGRKAPPPTGWTGYAAPFASGADVHEWATNGAAVANIGLRLPETILGIDVDNYDGKPGLVTMLAAVERLGPLPKTYVSTSRPNDEISGIRLYRVPPGRRWADQLGAGVELVHYGHRYVVASPSIHPEGRVYRWRSPEGIWLDQPPAVADPPLLPAAWVADLDRGDISERSQKADVRAADVQQYLVEQMPPGTPCTYVTRLLDKAAEELAPAASRHDSVRTYVGRMVRAGDQGHRGAATGLDTLESVWQQALHRGKARKPDAGEWERMVTGAVALVVAAPTSPMDKGCCPPEPVLLGEEHGVLHAEDPGVLHAEDPGVVHQKDTSSTEAPDYAATMAIEVEREAYRIRVRDAAREKVNAEKAGAIVLPPLTPLRDFLAVPDEDVTHRITGLWPSGGRVVLSAQHKAGKTTLTGNLIRSLVDGRPFLDAYALTTTRRVVLLDNELDARMLRRWLRDQNIANTGAVELIALRGRLSTFNILDAATRSRWAEHIGAADVLLFDCLRPALDALGLSEDKDAGRFLEALDELNAEAGIGEALVVHHMGHNGERSRGDSRILDWPDAVWRLVKDAEDEETGAGQVRRYLTAYGRDVDVPESLLAYDPATRRLSVAGGTRKDSRAEGALGDVTAFVEDNPRCSQNAIERGVGGKAEVVRKALRLAVERGLVDREKAGQRYLHTTASHRVPTASGRSSANRVPASIDADADAAPDRGHSETGTRTRLVGDTQAPHSEPCPDCDADLSGPPGDGCGCRAEHGQEVA
jgi:hypothetical protein